MRGIICLAVGTTLLGTLLGCTDMSRKEQKTAAEPAHPQVIVQGVDGTLLSGELLNGSVTVDSGQGELTLLTDHLHSISMTQDMDKLDSDSVKVAGKVKDTRFLVRNEHGVFTLAKDRLRKIEFITNPAPEVAHGSASATAQTAAAAMK